VSDLQELVAELRHDIRWLRYCSDPVDHARTDIDGGCPISIPEHCEDIAQRVEEAANALEGLGPANARSVNEEAK